MCFVVIIMFFLVLALAVYPPLFLLAAIGGVIATIHYFATLDWEKDAKEGYFTLGLVVVAVAILVAAYAYFGIAGVVVAVIAMVIFVGLTS